MPGRGDVWISVGVLGWRFVMYREAAFMYDKRDHADG
jgi:hypothetical protein